MNKFRQYADYIPEEPNAIEQLRAAIEDEGPVPIYHTVVMLRHRKEWPTLWAAIDRLLGEDAR